MFLGSRLRARDILVRSAALLVSMSYEVLAGAIDSDTQGGVEGATSVLCWQGDVDEVVGSLREGRRCRNGRNGARIERPVE